MPINDKAVERRRIARFALAGSIVCGLIGGSAASASAQERPAPTAIDQDQVVTGVPAPLPEDEAEPAGAAAVAAAIRCEAHAGIGGDGITYLSYTGSAVDCRPTWTYSFRLRFTTLGGSMLDEHLLQGKSGATSYTLPTHKYFFGTVRPIAGCSVLRIYHSATVGQNLVDNASSCYGGWDRASAE